MSYYIGTGPADVINSFIKRYFYGMRRNDNGELFLLKSDQQKGGDDAITINEVGDASGNFPDFEEGISYLDGINETHDIVYENLRYQQLKWDNRSLLYYVDSEGYLVLKVSEKHTYPADTSPPGY
tara:strand:+ start:1463 stop:1837 length:375 start_codon:yes stop_codon:yes gene_type:complete